MGATRERSERGGRVVRRAGGPTQVRAASTQLRQDVAAFFKELRPALGGQALPYVWVPEWHPGGHGLHVHFIVGRYVRQSLIREAVGSRDRAHQADR